MSNSPPRTPPNLPPLAFLPDDLITEILSFSDVKSLMRMRCVSTSWNSIISNSNFIKLHLKRSTRNPNLTLFFTKSQFDFDNNVLPFPVHGLIENNPLITLPNDSYYRLHDYDCRYVNGSCNGLLCLLGFSSTNGGRELWFRFWNPAMGQMSQKLGFFLDVVLGLYTHYKFAFGYDELLEIYKVVLLVLYEDESRTDVFVLNMGDCFWRRIRSFPGVPLPFRDTNPGVNDGVYLNGCLNWLALRKDFSLIGVYDWKHVDAKEFVIVSLHLGTETYVQWMPPCGFDEMSPVEPSICILMDCLCFSNDDKRMDFVIWKMEEFGDEESWMQLVRISYQNLESLYHEFVDLQHSQWLPLCLSHHGDTLILANKQEQDAVLYNLRETRSMRTRITDEIQWFSAKVYVESLVSPTF